MRAGGALAAIPASPAHSRYGHVVLERAAQRPLSGAARALPACAVPDRSATPDRSAVPATDAHRQLTVRDTRRPANADASAARRERVSFAAAFAFDRERLHRGARNRRRVHFFGEQLARLV